MGHCSNLYHVYNYNYSYLLATFLQATLVRYSFHTTIRYSAHNIFCKHNTYSLDLQTLNLSSHKAYWITTDCWPALS